MAVLPASQLLQRPGSVGLAIKDAHFELLGAATGAASEIVFHGPSVMLGYADNAADLARGDELGGVLHTGDTGYFDADGFLYLDGRIARMAKVSGLRINLDAVERLAAEAGAMGCTAAITVDDQLIWLWCELETDPQRLARISRTVAARLGLNHHGICARGLARLPLLPNGKVDYRTLSRTTADKAQS